MPSAAAPQALSACGEHHRTCRPHAGGASAQGLPEGRLTVASAGVVKLHVGFLICVVHKNQSLVMSHHQ